MKTSDGLTLFTRHWPAPGAAKGTVLIVHGLGEHSGRYAHVADFLNPLGWSVRAYDHRGHGQSEGKRGDIAAPDSLWHDLGQMVRWARSAQAQHPLVLLGHSMGGLLAARYVAEGLQAAPAPWFAPVDGLVLSSPAIDLGLNPLQRLLTAIVPRVAPHLCVGNGLDPSWVCNNPATVQAYRQDPLVHDRISGLLAHALSLAGPQVLTLARQWATPTLLMWAGADRCLNPAGSQALADTLPPDLASTHCFTQMGHEIFNELDQALVFAMLQDWLQKFGHSI